MSTHPVQIYLSYLQTEELVRCIERTAHKLSTLSPSVVDRQREVLEQVQEDLRDELARRQLSLLPRNWANV